jgi:hypothetical protein
LAAPTKQVEPAPAAVRRETARATSKLGTAGERRQGPLGPAGVELTQRQGPGGAGAGVNGSFMIRSTFSRLPSATGSRPPKSRRASSTRPERRGARKPKSARKSAGEIRLVHPEPLVLRVALAVAKRERLECLRTSVARIADRREEERQHLRGRQGATTRVGAGLRVVITPVSGRASTG